MSDGWASEDEFSETGGSRNAVAGKVQGWSASKDEPCQTKEWASEESRPRTDEGSPIGGLPRAPREVSRPVA
jgi:hypothetical protein